MKISVLGCGRWGSFIGWYLVNNGHKVIQWGRKDSPSFTVLKENGKNEYVELDERITLTDDLKYAVTNSDIIIIFRYYYSGLDCKKFFKVPGTNSMMCVCVCVCVCVY